MSNGAFKWLGVLMMAIGVAMLTRPNATTLTFVYGAANSLIGFASAHLARELVRSKEKPKCARHDPNDGDEGRFAE